MKILIPTIAVPPQRNIRTEIIRNITPYLAKNSDVEIIWLSIKADRTRTYHKDSTRIIDIHDYSDAKSLLDEIKPDCVIVSNTWESIQYALSLACKYLKIPLTSFFLYNYNTTMIKENPPKDWQNKYSRFRRFFLSTVAGDPQTEKKFMKRGRAFFYRYRFLMKTKKKLKIKQIKILGNFIQDFFMIMGSKHHPYNELCDIHLLSDDSWIKPLTKLGIDEKKLCVTGNPFWDSRYKKIHERNMPEPHKNDQIRILIVTDSLVEHGIWTTSQKIAYLTKLFTILKNEKNISFSIKIHPATENISSYESLIKKLGMEIKIFQHEDLWDIIDNFDIVVSYGSTTAHTELSSVGIKLVLLNPNVEYPLEAMVKEGISNGHIIICEKFEDLIPIIKELLKQKIELSQEFKKIRNELIFKFKGNAGINMANAIINQINKT